MVSKFINISSKRRRVGTLFVPTRTDPRVGTIKLCPPYRTYPLSVLRIRCPIFCNLLFMLVAHRQQHRFGVVQIASLFAVIFEHPGLDDRVHRTGFLAETAEDALGHVDVISRGAARAVLALSHFDLDRQCRTYRFAQLAADAALFAIGIAALSMQAAEAETLRGLLFRELDGDLARKEIPPGQRHALDQFVEQKSLEEIFNFFHVLISLYGYPCTGAVNRAPTTTNTESASIPRSPPPR